MAFIIPCSILLGFVLGWMISSAVLNKKKPIGTLVIDKSDPYDGPYTFLEGTVPIDKLEQHKYIWLKVEKRNYISQK